MSIAPEDWPELQDGEVLVDDEDELLWRQVHPQRLHEGIVSSEAFEPGRSDEKQLSCSRASKASAQEAFDYHTNELKLSSSGSAAVALSEVCSEKPIVDGEPEVAALRAIDDSATATDERPLPPGHTYVDFSPLGGKRITKKAKQLAFFAKQRGGILFPKT